MANVILTKTEKILDRRPDPKADEYVVTFTSVDDTGINTAVMLTTAEFEDLGSPETITVTIQPGDLLNEESDGPH